jgi:hypothetical protein
LNDHDDGREEVVKEVEEESLEMHCQTPPESADEERNVQTLGAVIVVRGNKPHAHEPLAAIVMERDDNNSLLTMMTEIGSEGKKKDVTGKYFSRNYFNILSRTKQSIVAPCDVVG